MEPYVFMYGKEPWPAGITTLQFYAPVRLEQNPELAELVLQWREALGSAPVRIVEDQFLHVTLEAVTDKPAGEIGATERANLAEAMREALNDQPAYRGRAGSCLAYVSGAIVDISPAEPLVEFHRKLRHSVQSLRGPAATEFKVGKPHISLGYATAKANSDPLQRQLRKVDPNSAPLVLSEIQLVEVGVDQRIGQLRWETVAKVNLIR